MLTHIIITIIIIIVIRRCGGKISTRIGRFDDDFIMSAWPKGCDRKRVYYYRRRRGGDGPRLAAKTFGGGGGATTLVGAHPIHAAPVETRDRHIVASVLACFAKGADLLNRHVHRSRACARRDRDRIRSFSHFAVMRGAYCR